MFDGYDGCGIGRDKVVRNLRVILPLCVMRRAWLVLEGVFFAKMVRRTCGIVNKSKN